MAYKSNKRTYLGYDGMKPSGETDDSVPELASSAGHRGHRGNRHLAAYGRSTPQGASNADHFAPSTLGTPYENSSPQYQTSPTATRHSPGSNFQNNNSDIRSDSEKHYPGRTGHGNMDNLNNKHDEEAHDRPSLFTRIRASGIFQRLMRVLQFLSAIISLILFSIRIAKIHRLLGRFSSASGAVEGIIAAAVAYTIALMVIKFFTRGRGAGSRILTWLLVVLDIAFVGGFIAVAELTSPKHGGDSAPCSNNNGTVNNVINNRIHSGLACNLPWGTFGLAIFSTILHAITAIFREAKTHHRQKKLDEQNADHHAY